jgi:hypothetical protein
MTKITRIEKQPADFDRPADRYTFKLYGPHHIAHKGEKLIATVKMNVGDLSLNECDDLPILFSKAPQMQARITELERIMREAEWIVEHAGYPVVAEEMRRALR